ncbi:MAG: hypothetical protein NC223_00290 [Butyrivibrio sp.]|nr:hypothetical protein [Butyrivibrio sp.]
MTKKSVFTVMALAFVLLSSASGCTMKSSSGAVAENGGNSRTNSETEKYSEAETKEPAVYKSLIEKYVGETGDEYKAYDEILRWDSYHDTVACMQPSKRRPRNWRK